MNSQKLSFMILNMSYVAGNKSKKRNTNKYLNEGTLFWVVYFRLLLDFRSFHHRSFHHRSIQHGWFIMQTVHHRSIHHRSIHPRAPKLPSFRMHFGLYTYPNSTITGCYDEVRGMIRCLPSLAHVHVEDVLDAFEELATAMPQHQGMDELLTYFEHTYVRGRRLPGRGRNYRLALFPASFLQATAGSKWTPKKKVQSAQRSCQTCNWQQYCGRADRLTFLRAMAHLLWF